MSSLKRVIEDREDLQENPANRQDLILIHMTAILYSCILKISRQAILELHEESVASLFHHIFPIQCVPCTRDNVRKDER